MENETIKECPRCGTKLRIDHTSFDEEYPIHRDTLVCPKEGCGYVEDAFTGKERKA